MPANYHSTHIHSHFVAAASDDFFSFFKHGVNSFEKNRNRNERKTMENTHKYAHTQVHAHLTVSIHALYHLYEMSIF